MTGREFALVLRAADALEDGDHGFAAELLEIVLAEDVSPMGDTRCVECDRWPGERWSCSRCALREAA